MTDLDPLPALHKIGMAPGLGINRVISNLSGTWPCQFRAAADTGSIFVHATSSKFVHVRYSQLPKNKGFLDSGARPVVPPDGSLYSPKPLFFLVGTVSRVAGVSNNLSVSLVFWIACA